MAARMSAMKACIRNTAIAITTVAMPRKRAIKGVAENSAARMRGVRFESMGQD